MPIMLTTVWFLWWTGHLHVDDKYFATKEECRAYGISRLEKMKPNLPDEWGCTRTFIETPPKSILDRERDRN